MIVDTCVWSLLLSRKSQSDHPAALLLSQKIREGSPIYLTGIICQEILQGIRTELHRRYLKNYLLDFELLDPQMEDYQEAAELFILCRKKGTTLSTIDCLIASLALRHHVSLLTTDSDFLFLEKNTDLQIIDWK